MRKATTTFIAGVSLAAIAGTALGFAIHNSNFAVPTQSEPPGFRDLFPHESEDVDVAQRINDALNVMMDIVENTSTSVDADIDYLRDLALDDANDERVRRYTLAMIEELITQAELTDDQQGQLAQSFIDLVDETYGNSTPALRFAVRANVIRSGLFVYSEFAELIEQIENDEEVIIHIMSQGIDPSWWSDGE